MQNAWIRWKVRGLYAGKFYTGTESGNQGQALSGRGAPGKAGGAEKDDHQQVDTGMRHCAGDFLSVLSFQRKFCSGNDRQNE